jgi:hypothetical protein
VVEVLFTTNPQLATKQKRRRGPPHPHQHQQLAVALTYGLYFSVTAVGVVLSPKCWLNIFRKGLGICYEASAHTTTKVNLQEYFPFLAYDKVAQIFSKHPQFSAWSGVILRYNNVPEAIDALRKAVVNNSNYCDCFAKGQRGTEPQILAGVECYLQRMATTKV